MNTNTFFKAYLMTLFTGLLVCQNVLLQAQKNSDTAPVTEQKAIAFQYLFSGVAQPDIVETNIPKNQVQTCGTQLVYRSIDGQCNNIANAEWGSANIPLARELSAEYGSSDPLNSIGGVGRPNPRSISNAIFQQDSTVAPSSTLSSFVFSWGQFLDHDIGISPESETETTMIFPTGEPGDMIIVPFTFHRSEVFEGTGVTTPRAQENIVTAWIDGSQIYGSDVIRSTWLRQGTEGKLRTSSGNLLPYNTIDGEAGSAIDPTAPAMATAGLTDVYFVAGDIRANEQSSLTSLHTLFVREHNRICDEIMANNSNLDPLLDDQSIYSMARKQVVALLQKITCDDFLPSLGINLSSYSGYDSTIRPDLINGFSTAAYRLGHTMVTNELLLLDDDGNSVGQGSVSLIQAFFNPGIIAANGIEPILNGLAVQFQEEIDANMVEALRTFLFTSGPGPGLDLAALNIQRGRDHGLADYNAYRTQFTGSPASSFSDVTSDPVLQNTLNTLYDGDINDVDVWVGLLSEDKLPSAEIGATLHNMLSVQFGRLRDGDYYFYLNDPALANDVSTIQNTSLSDLIKRNTNIVTLQDNVFGSECNAIAGNCCSFSDSLSLVALYNSTEGETWTNLWDLTQPMTTWYGVTLNQNGCVKVLNLGNNNLWGSIPTEIGDFQYLTYLNLSNNFLFGNLPPSIGNLPKLGFLDVRNNQLDGNIPATLSNLPILTFLHLEDNEFTGGIPAAFTDINSLGFLYLNNNNLDDCYDPALIDLCGQINNSFNANISAGNQFPMEWIDFCNGTGSGSCDEGVWPGDMDASGAVEELDVLFWAIAEGNTGPVRPGATTAFTPQPTPDWQFAANNINNKHQDADGNGIIDGDDLTVVSDNLGQVIGPMPASFVASTLNYSLEPLPPASGYMRYALHVENLQEMPVTAHGLTCRMSFGSASVTDVTVDVTNSSLMPDEVFKIFDSAQNTLILALTRTDGVNVLCGGPIATLTIITDSDEQIGDVFGINISGDKIEVNGDVDGVADLTFYDTFGGFSPAGNNIIVTASVMHEQCNMLGKASAQVFGGTPPYAYMWSTGANTATVENLPSGTYSVMVTDSEGLTQSLEGIQIMGQVPIYDDNGNMICASECPDFANPTGMVSNNACQASNTVTSDGTVMPGSDVQFQAGEAVIFNPGFSVDGNADFSAEIQDCDGNN